MVNICQLPNIKCENDVVIIDEKYYLFHQKDSGQRQMEYFIGNKKVSLKSKGNFKKNLFNNIHLSEKYQFDYCHLICEAKEVNHSDIFEKYTGHKLNRLVDKDFIHPKVIYPQLNHNEYYVGDHHSNEKGAIKQILSVLEFFGLLSLLPKLDFKYLSKDDSEGNLAKKLGIKTSEIYIEHINGIRKVEPLVRLTRYKKGNSGNIQYMFNQEALLDKRLITFGDSFIAMHLEVWGIFFKEIIHLRNSYIMEDVVRTLSPDLVITSNAERYLTSVISHEEDKPYFLYYLMPNVFRKPVSKKEFEILSSLFTQERSQFMMNIKKYTFNLAGLDLNAISFDDIYSELDVSYIVKEAVFREKEDLLLAFKLMSIAHKFKPQGPFICQKLEEYKNRL